MDETAKLSLLLSSAIETITGEDSEWSTTAELLCPFAAIASAAAVDVNTSIEEYASSASDNIIFTHSAIVIADAGLMDCSLTPTVSD